MYKTRKQTFSLIGHCHFWGGTVNCLICIPLKSKEPGQERSGSRTLQESHMFREANYQAVERTVITW
jgi:hypothetical protein